mmetsp:Transcript_6899/g.22622  ORF Transcript_6899/g.22622 Transcript_6899/m.22622 type:complete len:268 (-) Transcript_6899:35-838(-)
MSSHDEVKVVLLQKFAHDVGAKRVRDAAVVLGPPHDVRLRVRPEQIAQQARVGHVCGPHDALDLLWLLQVGRQTSMYAKDLLVDNGREGQQIKHLLELLPNLYIQTPLAFIIEAIDAVDRRALVVATQKEEIFRVLDFVGEKQAHAFQAVFAPIHVVAKKEVVGVRGEAAVLEQPKQVVVLPVDVAHDLDRCLKLKQRRLIADYRAAFIDQQAHLLSRQVHVGAGLLLSRAEELLDDGVKLRLVRHPGPVRSPALCGGTEPASQSRR